MSSTIVSARSLFFQKELHEDLIEVKSIFLFASLRTETSGLLRLRLLIPNGGYCFTMVVTALRLRLFILNTDSSFLYIFHFGKKETFGSEISPGPWYKKKKDSYSTILTTESQGKRRNRKRGSNRFFLDRICTHIMAFEGDSKVNFFEGSHEDYVDWKKEYLGIKEEEPKPLQYAKLG